MYHMLTPYPNYCLWEILWLPFSFANKRKKNVPVQLELGFVCEIPRTPSIAFASPVSPSISTSKSTGTSAIKLGAVNSRKPKYTKGESNTNKEFFFHLFCCLKKKFRNILFLWFFMHTCKKDMNAYCLKVKEKWGGKEQERWYSLLFQEQIVQEIWRWLYSSFFFFLFL